MAKKYENDFKVLIAELLISGRTVKEVSEEYGLNDWNVYLCCDKLHQPEMFIFEL